MNQKILVSTNESETLFLGSILAASCIIGCIIYLNGNIGTGKTVLCRGFLHGLGYIGSVKSPTYTLIESYYLSNINVHHCDFYRLHSTSDLVHVGIQDYFDEKSIFLIEWPKKKIKILPIPDIDITVCYDLIRTKHRKIILKTFSNLGQKIVNNVLNTKKFKYEIKK